MGTGPAPGETRREFWQRRRRLRLAFIVGRFVLVAGIAGVVAWVFGGGPWLIGVVVVAGVLLVLRLALWVSRGRRIEERIAERRARWRARRL